MGTKRTPRGYGPRMRISPVAVSLFKRMEKLRWKCTCPEIDWQGDYSKPRSCPACDARWDLHSKLRTELRLPPWHWPAYTHPDAVNPYPPGCAAAERWAQDRVEHPEKIEMYERLREAAKAA